LSVYVHFACINTNAFSRDGIENEPIQRMQNATASTVETVLKFSVQVYKKY